MRTLLLLLLAACTGSAPDDAAPTEADGDDTEPTGTTDTDVTWDTEDTEDPVDTGGLEWFTPTATCAGAAAGSDPIVEEGLADYSNASETNFAEIVDVEVDGDTVYAVGQGGLLIMDTSEGGDPAKLGRLFYGQDAFRYHRIELLSEGYVATSYRDRGWYVIDVSDPVNPSLVIRMAEDASGVEGLAYDDPYLYVTSRSDGLMVYDVSEPESPELLTSVEGLETTWEISAVHEGWLYAADNTGGIVPIDVSTPTSPVIGTPVTLGTSAVLHTRVVDGYLLVSAGGTGLAVMALDDPAEPRLVAQVRTGGSVLMADADGDLLVAVDHEGLQAWDWTDREDPIPLGREVTPQFALAVKLSGTDAYVGDWNYLERFTIDPSAEAGELDIPEELVVFPEAGGQEWLRWTNRGGGTLVLDGATLDDPAVTVEASASELAPGESAWLRLTYTPKADDSDASEGDSGTDKDDEDDSGSGDSGTDTGTAGLDATLCLSTSDPDGDIHQLEVTTTLTGEIDVVGQEAPDFALSDLDGNVHQLSEQRGTPVLLAYFATW